MPYFLCRLLLVAAIAGAAGPVALGAEPCAGFKWDVRQERELFAGAPISLTAGKDAATAPSIVPNRLYELKLAPQYQIAFALPPGKKMLTDGAFAGLAIFRVATTGAYRVSVDVPFWIDVVADGKLAATRDFQGAQGCAAPHKIVEYELAAGAPLMLQVSGSTQTTVRLTVTPTAAAAP